MEISTEKRDLVLSGYLTLSESNDIKSQIVELLSSCHDAHLDVVDASRLDISFLQILVAAKKQAAREGKKLSVSATPLLFTQITRAGLAIEALPQLVDAERAITGGLN